MRRNGRTRTRRGGKRKRWAWLYIGFLEVQHADVFTEEMFREALDFAVEELEKADSFDDDERRMGTTLVVVALNEFEILVGHVGDSRCYHFSHSGETGFFRTTDHSQVAEAVRLGLITEDEAFNHPQKKHIDPMCSGQR